MHLHSMLFQIEYQEQKYRPLKIAKNGKKKIFDT